MDNNIQFKDQKIHEVDMEKEVKTSFIQYAMSVIIARALPDVRDGLKPVHRRILYAMYEDNLTYDRPFNKSAATVGNVLGRYHPHGDMAVYDSMVRMAQPFSLRYPLIEGQGNFGNIDGDQAAAYRYTEARMSRLADDMMSDIEKNTVEFIPNFDNKHNEPAVLPSRFPNLLVNGSVGIAVGMATNVPPHNLREVIDGTIYLIENPEAEYQELMQFIKGPDFPTSAIICGTAGITEAYATGRGKVTVRARAEVDEEKRRIVITEIPYMVSKVGIVENIAECVKEKRIEGITELRDESSDRVGVRIVIEYRRDANGPVILNQLYKFTQLQDTCAINMLAIVEGIPKTLTLKEMLQCYLYHQLDVISRRIRFELDKARKDVHIYEGYQIAIDNIDEVISIIRSSDSISDAKLRLIERFEFSEAQAQAIVDMTLGRLSGLERQKIEERIRALYAQIAELEDILSDDKRIFEIIKTELLEIKNRFGDERRTEIMPVEDEIILEDLIERHNCVITMTHTGYIKRQPSDVYRAQGRGGKGIIGMATKEEDFVKRCLSANSHSFLMMFTNYGRVYIKKVYQIPEAGRTSKGSNIVNILDLDEKESVTALIAVNSFPEDEYLTMVTRMGIAKRTSLSEYEIRRSGGKIAITLDEGDELLFVHRTVGGGDIIVATKYGNAARFAENDIRCIGRTARGVHAIKLSGDDVVTGVAVVDDTKKLVMITEAGCGKRCEFSEFSAHNRNTRGVICQKITPKTGNLSGIAAVSDNDDIMIIANDGTIIRTPVSGIPVIGRNTGGVIVMRPAEGSSIANFAIVETCDETESCSAVEVTELTEEAIKAETSLIENNAEQTETVFSEEDGDDEDSSDSETTEEDI